MGDAEAKAPGRYEQHDFPAWIGGHGTVPYEQKTQQSPALGLSRTPHPLQS
jgi:hypothetical protein